MGENESVFPSACAGTPAPWTAATRRRFAARSATLWTAERCQAPRTGASNAFSFDRATNLSDAARQRCAIRTAKRFRLRSLGLPSAATLHSSHPSSYAVCVAEFTINRCGRLPAPRGNAATLFLDATVSAAGPDHRLDLGWPRATPGYAIGTALRFDAPRSDATLKRRPGLSKTSR